MLYQARLRDEPKSVVQATTTAPHARVPRSTRTVTRKQRSRGTPMRTNQPYTDSTGPRFPNHHTTPRCSWRYGILRVQLRPHSSHQAAAHLLFNQLKDRQMARPWGLGTAVHALGSAIGDVGFTCVLDLGWRWRTTAAREVGGGRGALVYICPNYIGHGRLWCRSAVIRLA